MRIRQVLSILTILLAVLSFESCEQSATSEKLACEATQPATAAPSPYLPTASIHELMLSIIDPSADYLWESVSVVSSDEGIVENQPRTDEEWEEVRHRAITLMEATNLLAMEGRRVVQDGKKIQDEDLEGVLTSGQIQKLIDDDHASFTALAHALYDTARETLKAIDDRDVDAFFMAGGDIDTACEACHTKYWYPNQALPSG